MKETPLVTLRRIGAVALLAPALVVTGCLSSGSDDDDKDDAGGSFGTTSAAQLNNDTVANSTDWVAESVPGCAKAGVTGLAVATADTAAARTELGPTSLLRLLYDKRDAYLTHRGIQDGFARAQGSAVAQSEDQVIDGDCGGTLRLTDEHSQGTTRTAFTFDNFCFIDDEGGQGRVNGSANFTEHGQPSDSGPIVDRSTAQVNQLAVSVGGETTSLSLTTFEIRHGNPAPWGPEPATATSPDQIRIDGLRIGLPGGETHGVNNLRMEQWEQGGADAVLIESGRYISTAGWHTDFSTPQTLVLDEQGNITQGRVELTGEGGDVVALSGGNQPGEVRITLNGQPLEGLDCTGLAEDGLPFDVGLLGVMSSQ